ncbi:peptidase M23 [Bacteroidia bacterium]|nr:peptidase M23 [Bacteroidia bacterium]GHT73628.1 peptidase M23 [Bacteroidia bacterium]
MSKKDYIYNSETLSYEVMAVPLKKKLLTWLAWIVGGMLVSTIIILLISHYFETPRTILLRRQVDAMQMKYHSLALQLNEKDETLNELLHRDNSVYRSIFEAEKIPLSMRESGFGRMNNGIAKLNTPQTAIIDRVSLSLNKIIKKTYIQSKSFDEISAFALQKEQMIICIPSIQPINISNHKIHISAVYGVRTDPIHHRPQMHDGIDFAGPVGTSVYTTGNGRVLTAEYSFNGYGNNVIIDHGFGYKTRYAHLSKILVHPNDFVTRGTVIGLLGNTGKSTGPHLHYEVRYHNNPINPVNFFSDDITTQEFDKIIEALQGKVSGGTEFYDNE